jgi:hypothetical protein
MEVIEHCTQQGYCDLCHGYEEVRPCPICKCGQYCRNESLHDVMEYHRDLCHPYLHQRLQELYRKRRGGGCGGVIYLSSRGNDASIYPGIQEGYVGCITCGSEVTYDGPLSDTEYLFKRGSVFVSGYRCMMCRFGGGVYLCPTMFMRPVLCMNSVSVYALLQFVLLDVGNLVEDVIYHIVTNHFIPNTGECLHSI